MVCWQYIAKSLVFHSNPFCKLYLIKETALLLGTPGMVSHDNQCPRWWVRQEAPHGENMADSYVVAGAGWFGRPGMDLPLAGGTMRDWCSAISRRWMNCILNLFSTTSLILTQTVCPMVLYCLSQWNVLKGLRNQIFLQCCTLVSHIAAVSGSWCNWYKRFLMSDFMIHKIHSAKRWKYLVYSLESVIIIVTIHSVALFSVSTHFHVMDLSTLGIPIWQTWV